LVCQHKNGLQGEFATAAIEKIFERRAEVFKHHDIVVALVSKPINGGHTWRTSKGLVHTEFVLQLGEFYLNRLELNSNVQI